MKRIDIDFAPKSIHWVLAHIHPTVWIIGGLALVLGVYAASVTARLKRQQDWLNADLHQAQIAIKKQSNNKRVPAKITIPELQAVAVNNAIAQLNLPWRDVLDAVESATPPTIALVALEPDAKKHLAKGMVEAKSSDAMIAYIEGLKRQTFFSEVTLIKHEINVQDPNRPIRFQFEAHWEAKQ